MLGDPATRAASSQARHTQGRKVSAASSLVGTDTQNGSGAANLAERTAAFPLEMRPIRLAPASALTGTHRTSVGMNQWE